jgi:hypothetical protein
MKRPLSFRNHNLIAEPDRRAALASVVLLVLLMMFGIR